VLHPGPDGCSPLVWLQEANAEHVMKSSAWWELQFERYLADADDNLERTVELRNQLALAFDVQ
jgi:hypothetical protein